MPRLFVVTDQPDLEALAANVLRSRVGASTRAAALEAIRRANPTLNLDRLSPGAVIVIPPVPGIRPPDAAQGDPVGDVADDLVGRVREALESLSAAADAGEEARVADRREVQELLGSALVRRLATSVPAIGQNVESIRAGFKQDELDARRAQADLKDSLAALSADLEALRDLL